MSLSPIRAFAAGSYGWFSVIGPEGETAGRYDVNVGIIGLGGMGGLHASTLEQLGADVVAGADLVERQRTRFAAEFDARTYETHDGLLADDAVDAVVVTTPNRFHEPIAVAALEAGCHVLVEKPLAHSLESAERIAAAAEESDGILMVGFHNRHAASMQLFEQYRQRGRFGDLTHVEANYVRRRGVPGPGSWFTDPDLAGGGALLDIGVHALDLALYALDFPEITEVTGVTRTTFGSQTDYADPDGFGTDWDGQTETYEVDDSVSAFLRTADGQTVTLEAAWATNREESMDVRIRGTDAGAQFDVGDTNLKILEADTIGTDHYADVELTGDPSATGYTDQDREFLEAIRTGATPETNTLDQAMYVQQVIDAIYRSSELGHAVDVPPAREAFTGETTAAESAPAPASDSNPGATSASASASASASGSGSGSGSRSDTDADSGECSAVDGHQQ